MSIAFADGVAPSFFDPSASTRGAPKKTLGQEDFLELLSVQMSQQDPLEPMKDTDYIAQMANFTSLEQMNSLTQQFTQMTATGYLGKDVELKWQDDLGLTHRASGRVSGMAIDGDQVDVVIDGKRYNASHVVAVAPAANQP